MSTKRNGAGAALVATSMAILLLGCGGGSGGSDVAADAGSATVTGNVSSASTTSVTERRSWIARIAEEAIGFARNAYAQIPDLGIDGIDVAVIAGSGARQSDSTDPDGTFAILGAPSGDVSVEFRRGNCAAAIPLGSVPDGAMLELEDVVFECSAVRAGRVSETFEGVVQRKPGSPQGNVVVCAESAGSSRSRAVMVRSAEFEDGEGGASTLEELAVGDRVEVSGERVGAGAPAAVDAERVRILGTGEVPTCAGIDDSNEEAEDVPDPASGPELPIDSELPS